MKNRLKLLIRLTRKKRLAFRLTLNLITITVIVGSAGYGAHGEAGLWPALKGGITGYVIALPLVGSFRAVTTALVLGCGLGFIGDDPSIFDNKSFAQVVMRMIVLTFSMGLVTGVSLGAVTERHILWKRVNKVLVLAKWDFITIPSFLFIVASVIEVFRIYIPGNFGLSVFIGTRHILILTAFVLSVIIGMISGVFLGDIARTRIGPGISVFEELKPYYRVMLVPITGFVFGYFLIAFIFACFFWAAWRADQCCAFKNLTEDPSLGSFLYFSIVTIATLGYGDITPASALTKILASIEVFVGIGWMTIVFAVVFAHVQPRFRLPAQVERRETDGRKTKRTRGW